MKITIAATKDNITDKNIDRHADYTIADGQVFGREFRAARVCGQWEANLVTDTGDYTLAATHGRLEGALAKACRQAVAEFGDGFLNQ